MGTGNTIKLHRVDELQMVYIPSCPEKKDGRGGGLKGRGNKFTSRRSSRLGPFLSPERTASAWREAASAAGPRDFASAVPAAGDSSRGTRRGGGQAWRPPPGLTTHRAPHAQPRPGSRAELDAASFLLPPGLCPPRLVASGLCIFPPKAGFFAFSFCVSSCPTFALPHPCVARYLLEGEKGSEGLKGLSGAGAPRGETERLLFPEWR